MARVLIVATTTGYQTRAFEQAAEDLGVELVYATDQCHVLEDPWRDGAITVRFDEPVRVIEAVRAMQRTRPIDGIVAVGDRPAVMASFIANGLGFRWHPPSAATAATSKLLTRGRLLSSNLPVPWFVLLSLGEPLASVATRIRFPCVVKPVALAASRGVIRANSWEELEAAFERVTAILRRPDIRVERDPTHDEVIIEGFIEGHEYALEGVLDAGALTVLAIFDKPDPLDGPVFEETIYVTPPPLPETRLRELAEVVAHAAAALGLHHGPVHAEFRLNPAGVFVLEIAPRPIGGLCSRTLRFARAEHRGVSLEELLLRHALGQSLAGYGREPGASGVMMIPIPKRGRYRAVEGVAEACALPGIDEVVITAKPGQLIEPLPDGKSYLGFIFAKGNAAGAVVDLLRDAQRRLVFQFDEDLRMAP